MTPPEPDMMHDEAAAWVALMDAGNWTDEDEAALQTWLRGDPRRQGALLYMQASWMAFDNVVQDERLAPDAPSRSSLPGVSRRTFVAGGGTALAASIAGGLLWRRSIQSFETQIGEIRRIPLEDGSIAAINTMSKIEVRLADAEREVMVEQGEAWFQVAKDPRRPFVVSAGRVRAQATGTAFSVRKRDGGADIIVTEGTVEAWADGVEGARVSLTAGEAVFVTNDAGVRRLPTSVKSADGALAWREGKIELAGESLSDAADEFNRYNKRKIIITDAAVGSELLDGVFRIDDPDGFALTIKNSLNVPVDISGTSQIYIGTSANLSPQ
jgi:transmembrane sensor